MIKTFLATLTAVAALPLIAADAPLQPAMDKGGCVEVGSKSVSFKRGYMQYKMIIADTVIFDGGSIYNMGKGDTGVVFFADKKEERKGNTVIWRGKITHGRGYTEPLGDFETTLTLQEDGLVKVRNSCRFNDGVIPEKTPYFYMRAATKLEGFYQTASGKTELQGKVVRFNKQPELSVSFFPDIPEKSFRLIPVAYSAIGVNPDRGTFSITYDSSGNMEFLMDLRGEKKLDRSEEYYANIDFLKVDSLRLPQYRINRNLVQNSSFESGFRYWAYKSYGTYAKFKDFETYSIDDTNAFSGNNSLKIIADRRKINQVLALGTFAYPGKTGQRYILSFYAKTDAPGDTYLYVDGRGLTAPYIFPDKKARSVKDLTKEWKRYDFSFDAPEEFFSIYFSAGIKSDTDKDRATVWIDAVQLETDSISEYVSQTVETGLFSNFCGNCVDAGKTPRFKLRIAAAGNARGNVKVIVRSFNGKTIFDRDVNFTADEKGRAAVALPDLDRLVSDRKYSGLFIAETLTKLDGNDLTFREYSRFSVIEPMAHKHKYRNIFNISAKYGNLFCSEGVEARLKRLRDIGFGSIGLLEDEDKEIEKLLFAKAGSYGFAVLNNATLDKRVGNGTFEEDGLKIEDVRQMTAPTKEELEGIEEICYRKAKNRPWVNVWYFSGEIEAMKPFIDSPEAVGKVLKAMREGLRRGNTKAQIQTGGTPWNIGDNGREWMRRYLANVGTQSPAGSFDATSIHTYQPGPENPDLDLEISQYIDLLKPFGYADKPIHFDEGMNYFEYQLSARGMTPHFGNSGDSWYVNMLSYDMGFAERISAAYSIRHWLAVFKYAKQVACQNDWANRRYFWDANLTVGARLSAVNVMARMIGSAEYHKTVAFAPETRSYIFISPDKYPVAVVWGFNPAVDRNEKGAPVFGFNFDGIKYRVYDFMGNEQAVYPKNGAVELAVGSFPFYIVGPADGRDAMEKMLSGAVNLTDKTIPVTVNAMPKDKSQAELIISNTRSVAIAPAMATTLNGVVTKEIIKLSGGQRRSISLPLSKQDGALNIFNLSVNLTADGFSERQTRIEGKYAFVAKAEICADGDLKEWKALSEVPLGNDTRIKVASDHNIFHIAMTLPEAKLKSPISIVINPSVTIQNWTEARKKFQDTFIFELRDLDKAASAYVHDVPEVQAASGKETPKRGRVDSRIQIGSSVVAPGTAALEIAIPKASIMPLTLESGSELGLNIIFGDKGKLVSLAPVNGYESPREPGEVKFILAIME